MKVTETWPERQRSSRRMTRGPLSALDYFFFHGCSCFHHFRSSTGSNTRYLLVTRSACYVSWSDDTGVESKSTKLVRLIPKSSERSRSPKGTWAEFRQSMPKSAVLRILTQLLTGCWMVTQTSEALPLSVPGDVSASTELSSSVPASCPRSVLQQQMQRPSRSHSAKRLL